MLQETEKDDLIKILKEANASKDRAIDNLTSDLVFWADKIAERDEIIQKLKDII